MTNEYIVNRFLLDTCRPRPQINAFAMDGVQCCAEIQSVFNDESNLIAFVAGSFAEFYIEPMLTCIGDIDVMFYRGTQLAIPRGHAPPTQLPDEFHDYVQVCEIIDSHFPGYVYLELRYLLTECTDDQTYNCVEYGRWTYLTNELLHTRSDMIPHGPALHLRPVYPYTSLSVDYIPCVRCLSWPTQAADWPTRHRNYEWPDSATVDRIVSNGCDLVRVAHRQCREDEWMGVHQWRLSFSRAENVLINSWMPIQQIVYHVLRVFVKSERLAKMVDLYSMANYHIKTLMLWACELKPRSWWTDMNIVGICVKLLHILSEWLTQGYCPQYFISEWNLFDGRDRASCVMAAELLSSITEVWVSQWLVDNYIPKCLTQCPEYVQQLFGDAVSQHAVITLPDESAVVTEFFDSTCQRRSKPSTYECIGKQRCAEILHKHLNVLPFITGSVAEFNTELLLPCMNDVDIMHYDDRKPVVAIPGGKAPALPRNELHNDVRVYQIVDELPETDNSHWPGYVYIRGLSAANKDHSGVKDHMQRYLRNSSYAVTESYEEIVKVDLVRCVRCFWWPSQAADWPNRQRNHGWPDTATVDHIVNNGSDVVGISHPLCRQNKRISQYQFRLSFSRAEIVLLNSWKPRQQIVYHMLRHFLKKGHLTDSARNRQLVTMKSYHVKTLMLWTCEEKSQSWWEHTKLDEICVELLHELATWLDRKQCKQYFVVDYNLYLHLDNAYMRTASNFLRDITPTYLSHWFVNRYLRECTRHENCPFYISELIANASESGISRQPDMVSPVAAWLDTTSPYKKLFEFQSATNQIAWSLSRNALTVHSCRIWQTELKNMDARLTVYFTAVALLQVVLHVQQSNSDNWTDVLSCILGHCTSHRRYRNRNAFFQAMNLVADAWNRPDSTGKLIKLELSTVCLHKNRQAEMNPKELDTSHLVELLQQSAVEHLTSFRQLEARDFGSVATIVTTDFEAMYAYKRGNYQHCLQLSIENVNTLLDANHMSYVPTYPEFIQLLDDDIVSLTALPLIVDPTCRERRYSRQYNYDFISQRDEPEVNHQVFISQLTLSLYLATQCQLKLRRSVAEKTLTLNRIKVALRKIPEGRTLDWLTLKFTQNKIMSRA